MNNRYLYFIAIVLLVKLNSCSCSCNCSYEMGCKVITMKWNTNDSLFTKCFCSTLNYYSDTVLQNAVGNYLSENELKAKILSSTDSIYESNKVNNISCNEKEPYANNGFECFCAK